MYQASEAFSGSILGHSRAFLTQIEIGEKAIAAEISAILYTAAANPGDYVTIGGAVSAGVQITMKNVSATELNFDPEEITERFVRGDLSRNTEGSGLGLSIAQSLTQLQGGTFKLYLDGDLFKVCLSFPQKISPTALSAPEDSHSEAHS